MREFYTLSIARDLFGKVCVITENSRIDSGGRIIACTFVAKREAVAFFDLT
jgi:hypothetical protein